MSDVKEIIRRIIQEPHAANQLGIITKSLPELKDKPLNLVTFCNGLRETNVEAIVSHQAFCLSARMLALCPDKSALEVLFQLLRSFPKQTVYLDWDKPSEPRIYEDLACQLSATHEVQTLAPFFQTESMHYPELFACLTQELVIHGKSVEADVAIQDFWEILRQRQHPLASLPLALLPIEMEILKAVPVYRDLQMSRNMARVCVPRDEDFFVELRNGEYSSVSNRIDPGLEERITSVGNDMVSNSNGITKVSSYTFASELDIPSVLAAVKAQDEFLAGIQSIRRVTAPDAFFALFCCAVGGGAYSEGTTDAYGRLEAWRSMSGLAGISMSDDYAGMEKTVSDATWFTAHNRSNWFNDIFWDFQFLALQSDRRTVVSLAITDSD